MSEAQKILDMIEAVSIEDTEGLDEIDARVWCYLNEFVFRERQGAFYYKYDIPNEKVFSIGTHNKDATPKYTRSRDALKSIRPEGWIIEIFSGDTGWCTYLTTNWRNKRLNQFSSPRLPTEELAELPASPTQL